MTVIPTWGYRAGEAQIFGLKEGESLPDGWFDSPAKVGAVEAAPASPPKGRKKPALEVTETPPDPDEADDGTADL